MCGLIQPISVPRGVPTTFTISLMKGEEVIVNLIDEDRSLSAVYDAEVGIYTFYTAIYVHSEVVLVIQGDNEVGQTMIMSYDPFNSSGQPNSVPELDEGFYGSTIAMSDNWLVMGAANGIPTPVILYRKGTLGWSLVGTIPESGAPNATFGEAMALHDDVLAVGAPRYNNGRVYLYGLSVPDQVADIAVLYGDDYEAETFGYSISMNGSGLLVGAPSVSKAFLFNISNLNEVKLVHTFVGRDTTSSFGMMVSLREDAAAIGSSEEVMFYLYKWNDSQTAMVEFNPIRVIGQYSIVLALNSLIIGEPSLGSLRKYVTGGSVSGDGEPGTLFNSNTVVFPDTGMGETMANSSNRDVVAVSAPNEQCGEEKGAIYFFSTNEDLTVIQKVCANTVGVRLANPVAINDLMAATRLVGEGVVIMNTSENSPAYATVSLTSPEDYSFSSRLSGVSVVVKLLTSMGRLVRDGSVVTLTDRSNPDNPYPMVFNFTSGSYSSTVELPYGFQPGIFVQEENKNNFCSFLPSGFNAFPSSGVSEIITFPYSVVKNSAVTFMFFLMGRAKYPVDPSSASRDMKVGVEPAQLFPTTRDKTTGGYLSSEFKVSPRWDGNVYCFVENNPFVISVEAISPKVEPWVIIVIVLLSIGFVSVTVVLILNKLNVKCKKRRNSKDTNDTGIYTPLWL